jgi:hypothetical protein
MMSSRMFDILEEIARLVRKNTKPFGGMQTGPGFIYSDPPLYHDVLDLLKD